MQSIKGIILSAGLGTRLRPLTYVTHKHLLPVYNRVMIEYPIETLFKAGITDIMLVTGEENAGQYVNYIRDGQRFGCNMVYGFQRGGNAGISHAIAVAREYAKGSKIVVILGDNYFEEDMKPFVDEFRTVTKGAMVLFNELHDKTKLRDKGVAKFDANGKLIGVVEKPQDPPSNFAQTGLYMYDERVFDFIEMLKPSSRGELEVSDLNNIYIKEGTMRYRITKKKWFDMGTFDALLDAANFIREKGMISK